MHDRHDASAPHCTSESPRGGRRIYKDESMLHSAAVHDICRDVCVPPDHPRLAVANPRCTIVSLSLLSYSGFFRFLPLSPGFSLFLPLSEFNGGKFSQPKSISRPPRFYGAPFSLPA